MCFNCPVIMEVSVASRHFSSAIIIPHAYWSTNCLECRHYVYMFMDYSCYAVIVYLKHYDVKRRQCCVFEHYNVQKCNATYITVPGIDEATC